MEPGLCKEPLDSEDLVSDLAGGDAELVAPLLLLLSWRLVLLESFDLDARDFIPILQSFTKILCYLPFNR